jgi:hypothetical protein
MMVIPTDAARTVGMNIPYVPKEDENDEKELRIKV